MPSPAEVRLDVEQGRVWSYLALGVTALGAFGLVAMSMAQQRADAPRRRPRRSAQGSLGCVDGGSYGIVKPGDYVAVVAEDEDGSFVEYLWVFVDSVSPDKEQLHGKIRGSASSDRVMTDRHGFRVGREVIFDAECIADRVRSSTNTKGEPVCGDYGALPHGLDGPKIPVGLAPGDAVWATVGPKMSGGRLPAVDVLERVRVRVEHISPLGIVRGRIESVPQRAELHGYGLNDDVDLLPDCIYGGA